MYSVNRMRSVEKTSLFPLEIRIRNTLTRYHWCTCSRKGFRRNVHSLLNSLEGSLQRHDFIYLAVQEIGRYFYWSALRMLRILLIRTRPA